MAVTSRRLRFEILKRDGFRCHYCGKVATADHLHVDHVIPESKGGTDAPENLVTACAPCNLGKSDIGLGERAIKAPTREAEMKQSANAAKYIAGTLERLATAGMRAPSWVGPLPPFGEGERVPDRKWCDWLLFTGLYASRAGSGFHYHLDSHRDAYVVARWLFWEQGVTAERLAKALRSFIDVEYPDDGPPYEVVRPSADVVLDYVAAVDPSLVDEVRGRLGDVRCMYAKFHCPSLIGGA